MPGSVWLDVDLSPLHLCLCAVTDMCAALSPIMLMQLQCTSTSGVIIHRPLLSVEQSLYAVMLHQIIA